MRAEEATWQMVVQTGKLRAALSTNLASTVSLPRETAPETRGFFQAQALPFQLTDFILESF